MFKRKRYLKMLMSLLLTALLAPQVQAETLEICNTNTTTNNKVPIYGYNFDYLQHNQIIYPESYLTDLVGMNISSITFYASSSSSIAFSGKEVAVRISVTSQTAFTGDSYGETTLISDIPSVPSGTVTPSGSGQELTINFDEAFEYSGGNLLIDIQKEAGGTYKECYFEGITSTGGSANSYSNYDANVRDFLPRIKFTYEAATPVDYKVKVTPTSWDFGKLQPNIEASKTFTIENKGTQPIIPTLSGINAPFSTDFSSSQINGGEQMTFTVNFKPTTDGEYAQVLTLNCGEAGNVDITLNGKCANEVTLADGTTTNAYLPVYGGYYQYYNQLNQMLYPASMIPSDLEGKKIKSITFYPAEYTSYGTVYTGLNFYGGSVTMKLVNLDGETSPFAATSPTKIDVEAFDAVKTIDMPSSKQSELKEWTVEFEEAVDYEGGDLLIEVETVKGTNGSTYFYGQTTVDNLGYYSTYSNYSQKFLPKVTFAVEDAGPVEPIYSMEVTSEKIIDCGSVGGNGSVEATEKLVVKNTGNQTVKPVITLSGDNAAMFTFSPTEVEELAKKQSREFTFKFTAPEGTALGEYIANVTISDDNGNATPINDVTVKGTVKEKGSEVVVCDGNDFNSYAPLYSMYYDNKDCQVQFIYPAEKLADLVGRQITKVTFYPQNNVGISGGEFKVSVKEVEQTVFDRETATSKPDEITDMTVVAASVVPDPTAETLVITFDQPYLYKGGNLAFETLVTTKSGYASIKYCGENQSSNTAFYYGNSSAMGLNPFLPKAFFESDAAPATEIATLRDLCLAADGKYTIQEELLGVYMQDQSVWFKDANGSAIDFQTPGAEKVYWINDVSTKDFDQSNWIEVDFTNVEIPEDVKGEEPNVKIQNLTGIFTNENGNPKLVLTETPAEVTALSDPAQAYVPNVYIPAHFEGTHQGYFFSYPKAQEYAKFIKAQWDGSNMVMTSNTEYNPEGLTGSFTIKPVDGLDEHVGEFYEFHGIIRKAGRTTSAPRIKAEGDSYEVEATDLKPESGTTTAISTIGINGNIKSVKYVNVAGLVSDRPFEGVNIVVTEYTDGSRTTTKMVR